MSQKKIKNIIEAALMVSSHPLSIKNLIHLFEEDKILQPDRNEIRAAIHDLQQEFDGHGITLVEVASGFRFQARNEYADWVNRLFDERPPRYSRALLETLSIIAYRQPVTRAEIESIRGVSVDSPVNRLLEIELIEVIGRAELPGRPIQYGTTEKFLEFSGIKDLEELPTSDILSNVLIDDFMRKDKEFESEISDETVGLAKETKPSELPLEETFVEVDWQKENMESDAYIEKTEE